MLGEGIGTFLFLTLASLGPTSPSTSTSLDSSLTLGASFTLATMLAGPGALLNPALTTATLVTRQMRLYSMYTCPPCNPVMLHTLPARLLGQLAGALLAATTLLYSSTMPAVITATPSSSLTLLLAPPPTPQDLYPTILHLLLASQLLALLASASKGSPLYLGCSMAMVGHILGKPIALATNPARELAGRLVVLFYTGSGEVFLEGDSWVALLVTWTTLGSLLGCLIHWILIEVPHISLPFLTKFEERKS